MTNHAAERQKVISALVTLVSEVNPDERALILEYIAGGRTLAELRQFVEDRLVVHMRADAIARRLN